MISRTENQVPSSCGSYPDPANFVKLEPPPASNWLEGENVDELLKLRRASSRRPFTCPVCAGSGFVLFPDQSSTTAPMKHGCHPCGGSGIVWSP